MGTASVPLGFDSTQTLQGDVAATGYILSGAITVPVLGNAYLIVTVAMNHGNTGGKSGFGVSGITVGGTPMTLLPGGTAGPTSEVSPFVRTEVWTLANPPTGSQTLTVTILAGTQVAGTRHTVAAAEFWQGVHQTAPFGTAVTATGGNGTSPSVTVASASTEIVTDAVAGRQLAPLGIGPGQTSLYSVNQGSLGAQVKARGSREAGAASVGMTWIGSFISDAEWAQVGVSVKPA